MTWLSPAEARPVGADDRSPDRRHSIEVARRFVRRSPGRDARRRWPARCCTTSASSSPGSARRAGCVATVVGPRTAPLPRVPRPRGDRRPAGRGRRRRPGDGRPDRAARARPPPTSPPPTTSERRYHTSLTPRTHGPQDGPGERGVEAAVERAAGRRRGAADGVAGDQLGELVRGTMPSGPATWSDPATSSGEQLDERRGEVVDLDRAAQLVVVERRGRVGAASSCGDGGRPGPP